MPGKKYKGSLEPGNTMASHNNSSLTLRRATAYSGLGIPFTGSSQFCFYARAVFFISLGSFQRPVYCKIYFFAIFAQPFPVFLVLKDRFFVYKILIFRKQFSSLRRDLWVTLS
jgi:hypothetical protein